MREVGVVGVDSACLGRCEEDIVGLFRGEEGLDRGLVGEVEFGVGAGDEVAEAPGAQGAHPGGADEGAQFCLATKTNPTLVRRELERSVKAIRTQLPRVAEEVLRDGAVSGVVSRITDVVEAECSRQLTWAPLIKDMLASAR